LAESEAASGAQGASDREDAAPLAPALRALASRAAEQTGGGVALIFVTRPEGGEPQLRAAAGFAVAQAARDAAEALTGPARDAIAGGREALRPSCPPALAERAGGELLLLPARIAGRTHGALAVGAPRPLDAARTAELARLAELTALRLDHAHLVRMLDEGEGERDGGGERSEEVLKLSEALFAQDIELLRKEEKLGKVEKLKNDFIEKMSRELRTPLNSIIEAIISVLTGENESLSDDAKEVLRHALDDGTAFQRTLQNILDLWKIKQNELPVELQVVNFRELVDEAIFSIQDALDGKPLRVEPRLQDPFPKLRTDLTKLNQVLFLLLDNAVRFTPEGKVEIHARVEDDLLICEVRDTGIGICPDDQQFVFDEFFQVDDTHSNRYGGSGLGLALVRDLLVLLDGEIALSSDVGQGTSVTFQIPVQVAG
jgi:signal transduction histidine kinase